MKNLFQHSKEQPHHISVGAVLINDEGKICVHRRTLENTPEKYHFAMGGLPEVIILMRESLENGELLEEAVLRGIREEFGAAGEVLAYLGSLQVVVQTQAAHAFEKTTLYFSVHMTAQDDSLRERDGEGHSELRWYTPEELISIMHIQGRSTHRQDLDESKIIETYVEYHT